MNDELKKSYGSLKRRPFLTPLWLAAFAAAILAGLAAWLWSTAGATTVIVIRHAEKQLDGSADPPLAAAGEARAAILARLFGETTAPGRIDAIYISPALRDRLTAAPLAARLRLTPLVVAQDDPRALVRRVLHEHPGERVLIVGHSDTVPAIVAALSGRSDIPAIGAEEFGTIYVVTVPPLGHAILLRLSY
ncbi:MAG: phosphoglycerate mutase family protein [Steroidobacteraceae bacterium]|jgi:broad specificity phosphatase PhoE